MSGYQYFVLPYVLYFSALAESRHFTLSGMEQRLFELFFHWLWSNLFLQSVLGGTYFNADIRNDLLTNPFNAVPLLGEAIPAASNFFINYVMFRAFAMTFLRLLYPHSGVLKAGLRWLHLMKSTCMLAKFSFFLQKSVYHFLASPVPPVAAPKTPQDIARATPLRNCRYSRDIGMGVLAIYIASLGYAIIAPLILPLALIFFLLSYPIWRYQQVYIYQAAYSSRGKLWTIVSHRIVAILAIMVLFTSTMLMIKECFEEGLISLITLEIFLIAFDRYLTMRYDSVYCSTPVSILEAAPRVDLDPELYVPPPLRRGAQGWRLEWGKAWEHSDMPRYGF